MKTLFIAVFCIGIGFLFLWEGEKPKTIETADYLEQSALEQLFSEENYDKLERLFEQVESELQNLVISLNESDVLDMTNNFTIYFTDKKELERIRYYPSSSDTKQIVVCKGEILQDRSTEYLVESIANNNGLVSIIKKIGEIEVIKLIYATKKSNGETRIDFGINTEYTLFITGNNGVLNIFLYTEEQLNMEICGYRKIKDKWYMRITPPPE